MNLLFVLSFFALILYLYIGFYTLFIDYKARLNKAFFIICLCFANWALSYTFMYIAENIKECFFWYKISTISSISFGSLLLYFFIILTKKNHILQNLWFNIINFLPMVLLIGAEFFIDSSALSFIKVDNGWVRVINTAAFSFWGSTIFCLCCAMFSLLIVYRWGNESKNIREKKQIKIITVSAIAVIYFMFLNDIILPVFKIYIIPPISPILLLVWVFGILYSLIKFKFINLTSSIASEEILEKIQDVVILLHKEGLIVRINYRVEELIGYKNEELIGTKFFELVTFEEMIKNEFSRVKSGLAYNERLEVEYKSKNNTIIPVKIGIGAVKDIVGEIIGFVITGQDMSLTRQLQQEIYDRKIAEDELRASNEKLQEIDKMKTDFLSTISHEFRTPLTSILGFSKIINKRLKTIILPELDVSDKKTYKVFSQAVENVDIIITEGEKLSSLINDILDIAKMEAGKVDWRMTSICINDVIEKSLSFTLASAEKKGLTFIKENLDEKMFVWGDFDRLTQVMVNLISNAIKFTDEGSIVCRLIKADNELVVSVIDTGIGISDEDCEQIFDKFKQIGDTLTGKPQGTGLGLSICKQIINYHKGKIWVKKAEINGSEFSFSLPFQEGDWL